MTVPVSDFSADFDIGFKSCAFNFGSASGDSNSLSKRTCETVGQLRKPDN